MYHRMQKVLYKTSRSIGFLPAVFHKELRKKNGVWYVLEKSGIQGGELIHLRPKNIKAQIKESRAIMSNEISKEDWLGILSSLFDMNGMNGSNLDEEAWLQDYKDGKSPHDAFYDEYPEYIDLED
ncbi:hypothetical protein AMD27_16240 (plasmid) [Acinetobacter sp. TGL-Y2]|nr:hypothetical protein AMD27_16240 [Acinetobacter sp. TGL-Y2]